MILLALTLSLGDFKALRNEGTNPRTMSEQIRRYHFICSLKVRG